MKKLVYLLIVLVLFSACSDKKTTSPTQKVPKPVFSPASTSFITPISVSIECALTNARIMYTTDGSDPTELSQRYTSPITVNKSLTIKAIAYFSGYNQSDIATATYTFNKVQSPEISLPAGTYYSEKEISISTATQGAEIYFTLNGVEPYISPDLLYTEPILLPVYNLTKITLKAKAFRNNWASSETITAIYDFKIAKMIQVSGGVFNPSHNYTVSISDFQISNYEITQEQWFAVMEGNNNNISETPAHFLEQLHNPVERVSWYEAIVYCNRRSLQEGLNPCYSKAGNTNPSTWGVVPNSNDSSWDQIVLDMSKNGYRLPTEMEWMFAAKGGNFSKNYTYSGSFNVDEVSWYRDNADNSTHPAGLKKANELELYDMSGNVWEWCWDWHGTTYPTGTFIDPTGVESGSYRILRGGSWVHDETRSAITFRGRSTPDFRKNDHGFRVVQRISTR